MRDDFKPLEKIASLVKDKIVVGKDPSRPYVGLEHMPSYGSRLAGSGSPIESISANNVFRAGDILFGKLRPQLRKCLQVACDGYCSTDILVLRCTGESCPEYAAKILKSEDVFAAAIRTEEGTKMPRTSWHEIRGVSVFCPDVPEQRKIATILMALDNLIERTEALIAKYQTYKQGLMHDLFTRGVDARGQLRPSQVDAPELYKESALGWIPKEWTCDRVAEHISGIEQGWSPDCESDPAESGEWGVLKTTAVDWDGFDFRQSKKLPPNLKPTPEYEVKVNDILMTRAGPNSRVGVVSFVESTQSMLILSDKIYRIVPRGTVTSRFLAKSLSCAGTQTHLSTLKTGLAESQTNISQEIVKRLWIAVPRIAEQKMIDAILVSSDQVLKTERENQLKLRVQKSGLMQDLLTGNVRVKVTEGGEVGV